MQLVIVLPALQCFLIRVLYSKIHSDGLAKLVTLFEKQRVYVATGPGPTMAAVADAHGGRAHGGGQGGVRGGGSRMPEADGGMVLLRPCPGGPLGARDTEEDPHGGGEDGGEGASQRVEGDRGEDD